VSERIYCYPESDVLIHKLDIHDLQTLQDAERDLTSRRLLQAIFVQIPCPCRRAESYSGRMFFSKNGSTTDVKHACII
jgi:hypothetical protein